MLVKVNNIDRDKNKVRVSKLDIDDYGSIITLKELGLKLPANDNSHYSNIAELSLQLEYWNIQTALNQ
jgi:hypothetical protein